MILLGASMFDRNGWSESGMIACMMTVAGTRRREKAAASIIPNLLTYPGSVYCQDFKGQNAAVTAQRRRDMGQAVHILDPMGRAGERRAASIRWQMLDPEARDYVEQIDAIVDALVIGGDDKNRFWDDAARTLIAGLIDYVVRRDSDGEFVPPRRSGWRMSMSKNEKTLGAVRDLLTRSGRAAALRDGGSRRPGCQRGGRCSSQAAEETVGGIMANALGHTKFLDSRGMRDMLSGSDFSALDLNKGNTTVYFVLPPEYLAVHQRALRLVVNTFLAAAAKGRKGKHPTLYILDEFYSLGTLRIMTKAAAIMRGYGVRMCLDRPEPDAAVELYPRNWETFFANAAQVQIFGVNDKAGADYVSARLGNRCAGASARRRRSRASGEWEPAGASRLRDGTEVGRSTSRESGLQIVLNEGGDPFLLRRTPYDKMFTASQYGRDPFEPGGNLGQRCSRNCERYA